VQHDPPVFLDYSRTALDREYNNSGKVSDAESIIQWYCTRSAEYTAAARSQLDLQYGSGETQLLDLYFPNGDAEENDGSRPVHVFFHGGYWQAMHKHHFSYVANAFTNTNAIVAIVEYDLIPRVSMSELVDQCRQSLIWLYNNIQHYGGNPDAISLSGHSAGGHLVAMMLATDWKALHHQLPTSLVKAGLALSGLFDLEPVRLCYLNDTLGLTRKDIDQHSPLRLVNQNHANLLCLYGEEEGAEYARQSNALAAKWAQTRAQAISGHHHFSIARELDNPGSEVAGYLQELLADG